ncbi:hypothetical protein QAD02_003792 [Eretmocerus hayati]|uniref:Uncharacterized protein n=1 Tax=Eretmocerus hayati TaxID=131215 RepID=A0ACC2NMV5_9HYME|nr:hypothetical protein QAD02_003792 [Eretmocerus hayati]
MLGLGYRAEGQSQGARHVAVHGVGPLIRIVACEGPEGERTGDAAIVAAQGRHVAARRLLAWVLECHLDTELGDEKLQAFLMRGRLPGDLIIFVARGVGAPET